MPSSCSLLLLFLFVGFTTIISGCGDSPTTDNLRPNAQITTVTQIDINSVFTLSAEDSWDEDGFILRYQWDMGDDSSSLITESDYLTYSYQETGLYTVYLTVIDDRGGKGVASHNINVVIP